MAFSEDLLGSLKEIIQRSKGRPVPTQELISKLGVDRSKRKQFRMWLKELARRGDIVKAGGAKWTLSREDDVIEGTMECHPDGYGFVRPDDSTREDVFVPPGDMLEAMHGDRVQVRIVRSKRDGRRSGRVIKVVERARTYVVGTFKGGYIYPVNERILERVYIPPDERRGVADGELAEARITAYPEGGAAPEGEIICRLGAISEPGVDLALIVSEHNLPREFPDTVIKAAKATSNRVKPEEHEGRVDLRDLPLVTVDPESARDFDDAILARREKSGWRLWVAIADVSHYVTPGAPLDDEALARGTSIYFPEGVIPMLPEEISAGIASLKPDVDRLVMVTEMTFRHDASPEDVRIYPAVMRSAMRLSYNQVRRAILENDLEERGHIGPERCEDLEVAVELAKAMRQRRQERGSLYFDLPEAMVILGAEGKVEDLTKSLHDPSHQMIEEFMLASNEAVAKYMLEKNIPALYRVHEPPAPEKLEALGEILGAFGLSFDFNKMGDRDLSKKLQRILEKAEDKPYETVVHQMTLRSMKQARYDPANLGHFGLAADHYLHFTSPIRRYPDLFVHRMLKRHLSGKPARPPEDIQGLALQCSQLERRAEEAERDMDKIKAARFMKERIGREYEGYITGVTAFGLFIEIIEHFVEGLVHETRLPPDTYKLDPKSMALVGKHTKLRFAIGDKVKVVVTGASIEKRQVDFDLVND